MQHLLLVIEVLSPSTARADRFTKRRRYQEARVPLYWIVDPERAQVEVWTPDAVLPPLRGPPAHLAPRRGAATAPDPAAGALPAAVGVRLNGGRAVGR
ncbi:MAG: Uma2 family endonuclease [Gemmatimonadetes bacterium]|nr:Uma2 family endonuclease [Gemmatimonadota bacterium]